MALEYGLMTGDMKEKELVSAINARLAKFFTGKPKYDIYKSHSLCKMKYDGGKSYREDAIPWEHEYYYHYFNKPYGAVIQLYPNVNGAGGRKFDKDGVIWNFYINGVLHFDDIKAKTPPQTASLARFILEGLPCGNVLIYEYGKNEERF